MASAALLLRPHVEGESLSSRFSDNARPTARSTVLASLF